LSVLVHPRKLVLFTLFSLADLVLTWLLLQRGDGVVYESNPVAGWWLAAFGWAGLAGFKVGTVLLVTALAILISRHRPLVGGRVLDFGCSLLAVVIGYSCYLAHLDTRAEETPREASELAQANARMEAETNRGAEYRSLMQELTGDLIASRCSLVEATTRLRNNAKAKDPNWLDRLQRCYGRTNNEECLAINLIVQSLSQQRDDPAATARLFRRLETEFRASYGVECPGNLLDWVATTGLKEQLQPLDAGPAPRATRGTRT
jgi:hypothetical protein